jgi:hypothetical protein
MKRVVVANLRALAIAGLVASGLTLATAPAAQADSRDCRDYLADHGHEGTAVAFACDTGEAGELRDCLNVLDIIGVEPGTASRACWLAGS